MICVLIYCINSGKDGQAEYGGEGLLPAQGETGKECGMNVETFERLLRQAVPDMKTIRELRIRAWKPVMILEENGENILFSDGTCGKLERYDKRPDPWDSGDMFQIFHVRL